VRSIGNFEIQTSFSTINPRFYYEYSDEKFRDVSVLVKQGTRAVDLSTMREYMRALEGSLMNTSLDYRQIAIILNVAIDHAIQYDYKITGKVDRVPNPLPLGSDR